MAGALYLVPTPIGNLEDITLRAIRVLREARLVLAEDTRTTSVLLAHLGLRVPLLSYTEQKHLLRLPRILAELAAGDVALVSDAGMPGLNDPGQALVAAVLAQDMPVVALPGPSAVPLAVVLAGFPVASFSFHGFLPRTATARRRLFSRLLSSPETLVAFESPHRLLAALADLQAVLPERRIAICRELTKRHEEVFRGRAGEALAHFGEPRGEIVIVIEGAEPGGPTPDPDEISAFMREQAREGASSRDAVAAAIARFGIRRREAYAAWEGR